MLSAPAHIPAISVVSFGPAFAAPERIRGSVIATFCVRSSPPGLLGQPHHRHQPGQRHKTLIIEHR
jgi:hypothetical protein